MAITLYGLPHSLYTGKARSYFVKAGVDFSEQVNAGQHYNEVVLPKAGNRRGIPTIELADQGVIRDSTAIIDHFESQSGNGFSPKSLKQNFLSRLFDVIGMEGLLRPAMHYRWNFPENEPLLKRHFGMLFPDMADAEAITEKAMNRMRKAGQGFGALPDTFALVETLYEELVVELNAHFATVPYLFGSKPSIGDFGLIAPLFAHLGRDPAPLRIMQLRGVELLRWVERMNRANTDAGEFQGNSDDYLANDEIPLTLISVLKQIAVDFMPETRAACQAINEWLAENNPEDGTTAERAVGLAEFTVRDQTIKAIAQPYRFYLLQRVCAIYDATTGAERAALDELLAAIDMPGLMDLRLSYRIGRANNLEVWSGKSDG